MRLESKSAEADQRKLLLSVWGQVSNWTSLANTSKKSLRDVVLADGHILSVPLRCVWVAESLSCDGLFGSGGLLNPILMEAKLCTSHDPASVSTWSDGGRLHWESLKDPEIKVTEKRGWMLIDTERQHRAERSRCQSKLFKVTKREWTVGCLTFSMVSLPGRFSLVPSISALPVTVLVCQLPWIVVLAWIPDISQEITMSHMEASVKPKNCCLKLIDVKGRKEFYFSPAGYPAIQLPTCC